jgi:hypothetical protein
MTRLKSLSRGESNVPFEGLDEKRQVVEQRDDNVGGWQEEEKGGKGVYLYLIQCRPLFFFFFNYYYFFSQALPVLRLRLSPVCLTLSLDQLVIGPLFTTQLVARHPLAAGQESDK